MATTARCGRDDEHGAHLFRVLGANPRSGWCAGNANVITAQPAAEYRMAKRAAVHDAYGTRGLGWDTPSPTVDEPIRFVQYPDVAESTGATVGRRAYVVQARRARWDDVEREDIVSDVPTFYLLADVQGILTVAQAERIALDVLGPRVVEGSLSVVETTLP